MRFFVQFVVILTQLLTFAIFARAILSWFIPQGSNNPLLTILYQITEPVLAPLRRIIPRIGMIDISPMVGILLLQLMGSIVARSL